MPPASGIWYPAECSWQLRMLHAELHAAVELVLASFKGSCPMATVTYVEHKCTRKTIRPWRNVSARWLDWDEDYGLAKFMWLKSARLTHASWILDSKGLGT